MVAVADLRAVVAAADDTDVDADAGADPDPDPDGGPEAGLREAAGAAEVARVSEALVVTEPLGAPDAVYAAAPVSDPEVGVAGAADRVGGIGASPDPRSEASNIGDAHVPEYALSANVDAPCEALAEPLEPVDGVTSAAGAAVVLDAFVAAVVGALAVGAAALVPVVAVSDVDVPDALVERAAESLGERAEAFAAVGLDACSDVAVGTERMPNPAGVLGVSTAADVLGPAVL